MSLAASLMSLRSTCLCWVIPLTLRTLRARSLFTTGASSQSRSCEGHRVRWCKRLCRNAGQELPNTSFCTKHSSVYIYGVTGIHTRIFWRFQQTSFMLTARSKVTQQRLKNLQPECPLTLLSSHPLHENQLFWTQQSRKVQAFKDQPAFWMGVREANAQKARVSPAKLRKTADVDIVFKVC